METVWKTSYAHFVAVLVFCAKCIGSSRISRWSNIRVLFPSAFCSPSSNIALPCRFRSSVRQQVTISICAERGLQGFVAVAKIYRAVYSSVYVRAMSTAPSQLGREDTRLFGEISCLVTDVYLVCSAGCCVAFGVLRAKMGQNMWTNCSCGLCCFFPCLYGCQNRGMIRARYSIPGRSVIDCAIWTLLPFCALCQELRHVKKHPYSHNIVNKKTGKVMAAPSAAPSTSSNKSHKKASNKPSSQKQSLRE